jgi:hypothetical protein
VASENKKGALQVLVCLFGLRFVQITLGTKFHFGFEETEILLHAGRGHSPSTDEFEVQVQRACGIVRFVRAMCGPKLTESNKL